MSKFTTVNLGAFVNAGRAGKPHTTGAAPAWDPELAPALRGLPGGATTFRGIPFDLAPWSEADNAWILLRDLPVTIPLTGRATFVVFAHFCDADGDPYAGHHPANVRRLWVASHAGEHLADYVLVYADGREQRQPIRRRFETHSPWPTIHAAFAALPHAGAIPVHWEQAHGNQGWWQAQMGLGPDPSTTTGAYWIYALPNLYPETDLAAVRLEPAGAASLAVAGITLFGGKHHPLRYRRLETLEVRLLDGEPADANALQIGLDLGIVARRYFAAAFDPAAWLASREKGWGQDGRVRDAGPLLIDVTAAPDATLRIQGDQIAMEKVYATPGDVLGAAGKVRVQIRSRQKTRLRVRVVDAETGRLTPARVHFRSGDGRYWPPDGHRHVVNDRVFEDFGADLKLGTVQYAYVDGEFEIDLPVGDVYAEAAKGFEYLPLRRRVTIAPGQQELTLQIERPENWRARGWVTADTHVHFLPDQTALLEAQAEGLNLISVLAMQCGDLFSNVGDLTGEISGVSREDTLIWVGTENRHHLLGHIGLLGMHGRPALPLSTGGPGESNFGEPLAASLTGWADSCRQQGGLTVLVHFGNPHSEGIADILLGKIDAVELRDVFARRGLEMIGVTEWYRLLNCGCRIPIVGGTDKMSAGRAAGSTRTYAFLGDRELTIENWIAAVRSGRTFATAGPLLGLQVEGHDLGEEVALPADGGTLEVQAFARSVLPFHALEIVANGEVVARTTADDGVMELELAERIHFEESGWIAVRAMTRLTDDGYPPLRVSAHTSPIYLTVGAQRLFRLADAAHILALLEGGLTWLDTLAVPASPEQEARVRTAFEEGRAKLISLRIA